PESSGLQAVLDPTLEVTPPDDGMIPVSSGGLMKPEGQPQSATLVPTEENISEAQKKPRRRRYYIIGAVAVVLIILGAVLGGFLGLRKIAQTEVYYTTSIAKVPRYSRLAFSSWHDSKGFVRHVFYQEANGTLRSCMSTGVSLDLDSVDSSWEQAANLSPDYRAQNMSGFATGLTIQDSNGNGNGKALQVVAFYLNTTNFVNAVDYGRSFQYISDSINYKAYQALEGSSLAAYWPYVLFQSRLGLLQVIKYASGWTTQISSIRARDRSAIAVVPTSRNYTEVSTAGRIAVFYEDQDMKLSVWEDPLGMGQGTKFANQTAWNSSFPDIKLYGSPIAALAVAASSDDADSKIHTFVLYYGRDDKIQQLRREGAENDWQLSTPGAFKYADPLTSIACVTGPAWMNGLTPDEKPNEVRDSDRLLEPASDLTRCVFLSGGNVMETRLDGVDWASPTPVYCRAQVKASEGTS
ncbi:unnamed protein product, partial [Clonostachys rhizophaga]